MKKTNIALKGFAVALIFTVGAAMLSSCSISRSRDSQGSRDSGGITDRGQKEPDTVIKLVETEYLIGKYLPEIKEYDSFEIEEVYFDWGGFSIGPTEYRYRGIVYLTEEEADRLMAAYEWEETDEPEFEFGKVDGSSLGKGPWYTCNKFKKDNFMACNVYYAVFDGSVLVFDFQQT